MARLKGQRVGAYRDRWKIPPADPVAAALAAARRKAHRTQRELAEDLGIKRSRLALYETGKRSVPWFMWGRLKEELPALEEIPVGPAWPVGSPHQVVSILADDRLPIGACNN